MLHDEKEEEKGTIGGIVASAIQLLKEDHQKVKNLFSRFEEAEDDEVKKSIVETALKELKIHTQIEEEIFYPAVRERIGDDELMNEAVEEHYVAKILISELEGMEPSDERFSAKFKVLAENVKHHIEEEESEMLPEAEKSGIDQEELGRQMEEMKHELMEEEEESARPRAKSGRRSKSRSRR